MTGADRVSACKLPRVTPITVIPHKDVVLPSALTSWVPSISCTRLSEVCSLRVTEHDAPESSSIDTE